jgi:hypothetical protein
LDVIASVAVLLRGRELTDTCQREHQADFSFDEIELAIEGPWCLAAENQVLAVGDDAGQLISEAEQQLRGCFAVASSPT